MANETTLTIVGNLTADPELRYTQGGAAVASFTVASTDRIYDRASGEWKDGEALFMRCSVWRDLAEHVAGSLTKGTRVIATGRLKQRSYQDREGNNRTSIELDVEEVGPSLRYATAQVQRSQGGGRAGAPAAAPAVESWSPAAATSAPAAAWSTAAPGGGGVEEGAEVPF